MMPFSPTLALNLTLIDCCETYSSILAAAIPYERSRAFTALTDVARRSFGDVCQGACPSRFAVSPY